MSASSSGTAGSAQSALVVLDVGKTLSKLTLWSASGELIERRTRQNRRCYADGRMVLDVVGIEEWLIHTLREFAQLGRVKAIIPVGHGAGAALLRDGQLVSAPSDYESPIAATVREAYDAQRDPFFQSGSPKLPDGLNLGVQLHRLEQLQPDLFDGRSTLVTWAQYWAWVLSGVPATEVTSLGCHSDLWDPHAGAPSPMAVRRGWSRMMAPLRRAGDVLGPIRREWADRTGLPHDVEVYCGLHDSNAALLAARGFGEIASGEATILSTGTWFVAMRSPAVGAKLDLRSFPANRDVLVNIDVEGRPVPSARFMGGREIQVLTGVDARRIDIRPDQPAILAAAQRVLAAGWMVAPTMAPGCGPFPDGLGGWVAKPAEPIDQRAAVSLYAALMADVTLDLVGATDVLLVEGRFAEAELFVRALAALRPDMRIYTANEHNDVSYGALRLVDPTLRPPGALRAVQPIEHDLTEYRRRWRNLAEQIEVAA